MVIDTSAILAIVFNEKHSLWVIQQLRSHKGDFFLSTVNFAEILIRVKDKNPKKGSEVKKILLESGVQLIAPSPSQAEIAADARLKFPLNLGDCFVYALAKERKCEILTLDSDFKKTDAKVVSP